MSIKSNKDKNFVVVRRKLNNGKYETLTFYDGNKAISHFVDWTKGKVITLKPEKN